MRPSFHPRLVNSPFGDPGLYIPLIFENRAVLFDLGDIHALSSRDILKIDTVFVTHTHMDHFIGFDRLLRLLLGRDKTVSMFGPEGFLQNVTGKLAGYAWNLVEHYANRFVLEATEVQPDRLISKRFVCREGFVATEPRQAPFESTLVKDPAFSVSTAILDHGLPCLAFSIQEQFHINIIKERVLSLGLQIGPWLNTFKKALFNHAPPESEFIVTDPKSATQQTFILGELADRIAKITPGQKVAYIADAGMSAVNEDRMIQLADGADHLFIEAAFLEKHREIAQKKHHLTARQAGTIAARAGVKQFTIFHFSPRYTGQEYLLQEEAQTAFDQYSQF